MVKDILLNKNKQHSRREKTLDNKVCKDNILFIESGTNNGGSIESLYLHLKHSKKHNFNPIVVLLNETDYIDKFLQIDINVIKLKDTIYTSNRYVTLGKILSRIELIIGLYFNRLRVLTHRIFHHLLINKLKEIVDEKNIKLIYLNVNVNRDLFGVILSKMTGVKCVSHLRSIQSSGFNKWTATFANSNVSYFIANSQKVKEYWISNGLLEHKILVIYNGIPRLYNKSINLHEMYFLERGCLIIGSVGRLIEWKRHDFLIDTFNTLLDEFDNIVLFIVGGGPKMVDLKLKVDKYNIQNKVIFTGKINNAKDFIKSFDILVLPSINEPFGRVIIEAMELGTAVIGSNSGGVPEIIYNAKNGYLFTPDDKSDLLSKMRNLILNPSLRERFSIIGMRSVRTKFSLDNYVKDL